MSLSLSLHKRLDRHRSAPRQPFPFALILLALAVTACGPEQHPRPVADTAGPRIPDSLVAIGPGGIEVWFTLSRLGRAADTTSCVERGLEIRHSGRRTAVPLLYTGAAPTFIDDSTMRAELWNQCKPVAVYRVNLMTGQPVRERSGGIR
jgi:hypothetical protein